MCVGETSPPPASALSIENIAVPFGFVLGFRKCFSESENFGRFLVVGCSCCLVSFILKKIFDGFLKMKLVLRRRR